MRFRLCGAGAGRKWRAADFRGDKRHGTPGSDGEAATLYARPAEGD
jgi:hypothetical protein